MDGSGWDREFRAGVCEMVEASTEACFVVDSNLGLICWNRPAEQLYAPNSQILRQCSMGSFSGLIGEEADLINRALANRGVQGPHEWIIASEGGLLRLLSGSARSISSHLGTVIGATLTVRDLTQLRDSQRAIESLEVQAAERSVVLETASRVALDILSSRTGVEALRHIAEAARTLASAQYAALGVARPDGQGLLEFVTVGLSAEEEARIGPRPVGVGILGLLLRRDVPLRVDRLGDHPDSSGFPPNHPEMDSFLGVPIRRGGSVLGSLYLTNKIGSQRFSEADEVAVQSLAAHAAVAIHNLQLLSRQRSLVTGLINAQEEERRAVAYDLHDGLTQYVMASHIHMEAYQRAQGAGNESRAAKEFVKGLRYLQDAVVESRRLVSGLRSLALDDLGLAGAVEQLFGEEKERAGWGEAEFIHNLAGRRFQKDLETTVYRVAQEALTNVRKHAGADHVRMILLSEPDAYAAEEHMLLEVRDWGVGFDEATRSQDYSHVGLQGIAERVSLVNGTYELRSAPGEGTTIRATFPVHLHGPDAEVE